MILFASRSHRAFLMFLAVGVLATLACAQDTPIQPGTPTPYVVAHRGSSADFPENTLAAYRRAIDAGAHAIEIDLRLTRDGHLVSIHDATVDRTTNGSGDVASMSLSELQALDAGSWFHPRFGGERVPTFQQILDLANNKVDVFLDLKDQFGEYEEKVLKLARQSAYPARIIFGVRSLRAAKYFQQHLPEARLVGLIPNPDDVEAFADAGVPVIRLWPRWLPIPGLVDRLRTRNLRLLVSAGKGTVEEVEAVLGVHPEWLFVDDPAKLFDTLQQLKSGE